MKNVVYLDYAAATPLDPEVLKIMKPFFYEDFYNPSALYEGARVVKSHLDDARASISKLIGAKPSEVIFTAGGTESANLAINGVMGQFEDGEIIISAIEHDAVRKPAENFNTRLCPVDKKGRVNVEKLTKQITDKTALVSIMYANNEVGTVQPIKEIAKVIKNVRKQRRNKCNDRYIYLHIDACQAPLHLDINVARLGVDLMTLNGGKIYGPKQSGILYVKAGVVLSPQISGGGQEMGLRSGTENVAFAVGFAKALELAVQNRNESVKNLVEIRDYFINQLEDKFGAVINGDRKHRLPNNVHAIFPSSDNERVLFSLDQQGVWAASGSACSASSEEPSHVLLAMGLTVEEARSSMRFTIGRDTTKEEINISVKALEKALKA